MPSAQIKTFRSGNSEAVRLPKEIAYGKLDLPLTAVRTGDIITIYPTRPTMAEVIERLRRLPKPSYVQERLPVDIPDRAERDWST